MPIKEDIELEVLNYDSDGDADFTSVGEVIETSLLDQLRDQISRSNNFESKVANDDVSPCNRKHSQIKEFDSPSSAQFYSTSSSL